MIADGQLSTNLKLVPVAGPTGSGASGTITVPQGGVVVTIYAHATSAGSISIGGVSVPIPAGAQFTECPPGESLTAPAGGLAIIGTSTDALYVSYLVEK